MTQHIVFLVDGTGSMGSYLQALTREVLPQCIQMCRLMASDSVAIDAIVYRDYDLNAVQTCIGRSTDELQRFLYDQRAEGGQDWAEAQKTAFNALLENFAADQAPANVVVLHYTDAPPHHGGEFTKKRQLNHPSLIKAERKFLKNKRPGFDWLDICRDLHKKKIPVFSFLAKQRCNTDTAPFYVTAGAAAQGDLIVMPDVLPETITLATIGVLSQICGQQFEFKDRFSLERSTDDALDFAAIQGNETSTGYLPHQTLCVPHQRVPFCNIVPVEWLGQNINGMAKRALTDEKFRDRCFDIMAKLFVPKKVLCLTYNAVFGKVWRVLCRFRSDERLPALRNALSTCVGSLAGTDKEQLQRWIEDSYDQSDEICAIIESAAEQTPFLILDAPQLGIERKELLSVGTSPSPGALSKIQKLLCSVVQVSEVSATIPRDAAGVPVGIPLALSDEDLFATLSHLLFPGVMFTMRPAIIVAMVAYLGSNVLLKDRAERFLTASKGRLVPLCFENAFDVNGDWTADAMKQFEEYPEVLSVEYINLLNRLPQFLTQGEKRFYERALELLRLRRAAKKKLTVQVGFTPKKTKAMPDVKNACDRCHLQRSITTMSNGVCGLCVVREEAKEEKPDCDDKHSRLVQCRTCAVIYAVVDVDNLNVEPRCHYCRSGQPAPTSTCDNCQNKFLFPDGPKKNWTCAVCIHTPQRSLQSADVHLVTLLQENKSLLGLWNLDSDSMDLVMGTVSPSMSMSPVPTLNTMSLFKVFTRTPKLFSTANRWSAAELVVFASGKPVQQPKTVVEQMQAIVAGKEELREDCLLCFERVPVNAVSSACGRCDKDICKQCAEQWWSQLQPGKLVMPTHLFCPFCRRVPTAKTLRAANRLAACGIVGRNSLDLNPNSWYAWCTACYRVQEAATRACLAAAPTFADFVCVDCIDKKMLARNDKSCPACNAPTEKAGGCNHMTCVCGAHWCFECGQQFCSDEIYRHMHEEHGGYF